MDILLKCPNCGQILTKHDHSYQCPNRHSFDIAKSGYLNLLISNKSNHGDNKQMIKARTSFLEQDYYLFLKQDVSSIIEQYNIKSLVDFACGEGYYTSCFPCESKIGIDLSKDALLYASKHDKSSQYLLSSIFNVPLFDNCVDGVTTLFAPTSINEIERILKPGGYFINVIPGPEHLLQLKQFLYQEVYLNEIKPLETSLKLVDEHIINETMHLDNNELIYSLFSMTPYAVKTSKKDCERLSSLNQLDCEAQFLIRVYHK